MILPTKSKIEGFSLLEMTIVVIVMTVLMTFAVPSMYRSYLEKAGNKTALEIQNIEDAARSYYLQKGAWPSSINNAPGDLESTGYLPSTWNALNPFNNSYLITPASNFLTVSTSVANGAQNIIASKLPMSNTSGIMVTSTIEAPGVPSSPVYVVTGNISDGGTIPLPSGYTDAQCQWFVSALVAETYDSSGKDGCENDQYIHTSVSNRVVSANTTGDCRRPYVSNTANYLGICLNV